MSKFTSKTRPQQRLNLLRRLNRVRREMEQYVRDLDFFNDLQRSRGGETIPENAKMVAYLAAIDQQIRQIRDLR